MDGHRRRLLQNTALKHVFGVEIEEIRGGWAKQHNYDLYDCYSSRNITKLIK